MIIAYLILLLGFPGVACVSYLLVDWMIKNFNSTTWIVTGIIWFILCTMIAIGVEIENR